MGNSGSINNISADDITAYQYRQRLRDANLDHLPMHWQNSYIKEPQPQPQPHIKVLPELNEGPRLRTTHNGAILHSGGTISGRRESAPPPLLQRARTSVNIELNRNRNDRASSRMHAQLSMLPNPDSHKPNYKKFGSEPDLRNSGEEETRPMPAPNPTRMSKSKMVKSKKKNPAPAPPVVVNQPRQQSARDFNANRFGWQPPPQVHPNAKDAPQKKLRLFKTKAESKRTSSQLKLASESSDSQFSVKPVEKPKEPSPKRPIQTSKMELKPKQPEPPSWKDNKVKVLPPPVFRREKTFDVSLLANRSLGTDEAIKNAREKLKSTNVQRPVDDIRLTSRQKSLEPERPVQKSLLDVKLKMRKHSQQVEATPIFDFKKELEEATKRRSLAVETLEKQGSSKEATSSDSGVGDRPVPKTRVNRTKRQNDVQKKEKAPTKTNAAPVKKIGEVKKTPEIKKEKTPIREIKPSPISIEEKKRQETKIPQLTKTFYFGMENTAKRESPERGSEVENFGKIQMEVIDQFAKSIMTNQRLHRASSESSESALSSEECSPIPGTSGGFEETNTGGIQLHVRPTLPRRQLEIPRFSPAAAWRMLNDEQKEILLTNKAAANAFINEFSENSNQPIEERIQRVYREPIPAFQDNKSGDSGISGDAGLPDRGDSPRRLSQDHGVEMRDKVGPFLTPWTPQQDLEEETSSDGELQKEEELNKYPSRAHVFSLSLPRESHLPVAEEKDKPGFSSLQKLKRTVSGAFSNNPDRMESLRSDNWLLSRSAPNSIENSQVAPASPQRLQQDEKESLDRPINIVQPSFSYLTGGKHVMYLPHYPPGETNDFSESEKQERASSNTSNSKGHNESKKKVTANQKKRESLQDVPAQEPQRQNANNKGKGHRFTFQSTVRQIERRRIAEKLSKEAEQKEVQRLSELEAMRRVEEEFQRKRAREKASIRHQLRLVSMEESQCTSLPVDWQTNQQNERADPDGASPTPSPTAAEDKLKTFYDDIECMNVRVPFSARILEDRTINKNGAIHQMPKTEILSEFQTPRRNYMDHRSDKKYEYQTRQMEHPAIVCHIPPKSDQDSYTFEEEMINHGGHNVTRDSFPPGFRGRSLCSSDSDMSSPSGGVIEQKQQFRSRYRYYYDLH